MKLRFFGQSENGKAAKAFCVTAADYGALINYDFERTENGDGSFNFTTAAINAILRGRLIVPSNVHGE